MLRRALLLCGIVSSLLYLVTDLIGGLSYDGYSFTSQGVSELMAVGAPSEHVVDPLFIAYGLLTAAFGTGVVLEGSRLGRRVRIVGGLILAYSILGLTGPTLFEMQRRGANDLTGDLPHVVLTGVLVLLIIGTIAVAASAFGKPFRFYSIATLLTMMVAGAASGPFGVRLAAGDPTPGFGIIERVNIYASLVWVAVLATLLHRGVRGPAGSVPHDETRGGR